MRPSDPCVLCSYSPNAANRWDGWYRYLQQFLSYGPLIAVEGNHEIETQLDGTTFAAYKARYGNDVSTLGGSGSPFYFSVNVPGAHIVVLAAYGADYSVGSAQVTLKPVSSRLLQHSYCRIFKIVSYLSSHLLPGACH